jgi:Lipid A 3-O-deacylase (PagL)
MKFSFSMKPLLATFMAVSIDLFASSAMARGSEIGGSIGLQLVGNTDLLQYEMDIRQPLPFTTTLGGRVKVASAVEVSLGLARENDVAHSEIGRFALIPELIAELHPRLEILAGIGAGFMGGDGEFTKHDLGGPFFFASKFGLRLPVTSSWGVALLYYHQSNGGLYDHNASLNMQMVGFYYRL